MLFLYINKSCQSVFVSVSFARSIVTQLDESYYSKIPL
jgi:hypothetical protein